MKKIILLVLIFVFILTFKFSEAIRISNESKLIPEQYTNESIVKINNFSTIEPERVLQSISMDDNMILVEGGTFEMGNPMGFIDEMPVHKVTLSSFYICKYEVTVKEYLQFLADDKQHYPEWKKPGNSFNIETGNDEYYKKLGEALYADNNPIVGVSWYDAQKYCEWLSNKTGKKYRLPTEAEWEYAARGGLQSKGYIYSGSNELDDIAWHNKNSDFKTHPVGEKLPNELGLFDMSGNVWEWCFDRYSSEYYAESPAENPVGPENGQERVVRGGSWYHFTNYQRVTLRYNVMTSLKNRNIGFRVVMTAN